MLPAKIRFVSLTSVVLFTWIAWSSGHSPTAGQEPAEAGDKGDRIKNLQKEWLAAARGAAKLEEARAKNGQGSPDEVLASTRMLAEAELEACGTDGERAAALEKILVTARDTERLATGFASTGQGREGTALKAKAERLRFEIALERAKTGAAAKPVGGDAARDLRDSAALAVKHADVKKAAVKVVEAQEAKARARLATAKARVAQAKAAESRAEVQFQRFNDLFKTRAIEEGLLGEQRANLESAKASRVAADSQVAELEGEVAVERARVTQAELEFEEARLRADQIKARLQPR